MDKRGAFITAFLILSLIVTASASSAICPDVTPLSSITNLTDPSSIAIDSNGNLYVTEGVKNRIKIYSQSGRLIGRIGHRKPLGIAVDGNGLYVTSLSGKLTIYGADLKVKKVVNTGIRYGSLVAVSSGRIYVSDPKWGSIRVYDKEGGYLSNIKADANFSPIWLTVEPSTGNIYAVSKAPAGVYVFSQSGSLIRKFYSDAVETGGLMVSPRGILLDSSDRVYISDALGFQTFVFDTNNSYVCSFGAGVQMNKPFGIAMGGNKILYVLDKEGSKIATIGIDDFVKMELSPLSLSFKGSNCGAGTSSQKLLIANKGKGVLDWTVSSDLSWITLSQSSGQISGGSFEDIGVSVNISGLSVGTYRGSITVSSQGASESIPVTVEVLPPPVLSVNPTSLSFLVKGSIIPPSESINIELKGDTSNQLEWTASSDSSWLKVSPSKGPSNTLAMSNVWVDVAGLAGGQYTGNIKVDAGCAEGSPSFVKVDMTYIKGGTVKVISNLDEATYTITGPATYSGTGTSYIVEDVPEGTYTITFGRVMGFKTPPSYSLFVAGGGVIEFIGNYKDLRRQLEIAAVRGKGPESITDEVRLFSHKGDLLNSFVVELKEEGEAGSQIVVGDVDGDGKDDILTSGTDGIIRGYKADGTSIVGLAFKAFICNDNCDDDEMSTDIALADLNGDGIKEIIIGRAGKEDPSEIRVFAFRGGQVIDTGVYFLAYPEGSGVNVSSGDIDGDDISEILTVQGKPSDDNESMNIDIRIWGVSTEKGMGAWKIVQKGSISPVDSRRPVDITGGDIDGDGIDELIVTLTPEPSGKTVTVRALRADGSLAGEFTISAGKDLVISAGDTDMDAIAELVIGDTGKQNPSRVRVYSAVGSLLEEFNAFGNKKNISGVKVSLGELGY
ncbi:MAG: SBBP repeat-containing protein [Nitrospirae bacterium]|nr:SBBP repeat-containing protein [Nitrospirota bacterium]